MGRGQPRKKAETTPPVTVGLSSTSNEDNTDNSNARKAPESLKLKSHPLMDPIIEEQVVEITKPTLEEGKPWVDIIKGDWLAENEVEITYTTPLIVNGEIEVVIEEQDVSSESEFWGNTLIMYAWSELSMNTVKKFMVNIWNSVTLPELYYNEEGYFRIWFKTKSNREAVLMRGPYTIYKKLMILHKLIPEFRLKEDVLWLLPIWVTFPQLPLTNHLRQMNVQTRSLGSCILEF